MTVRTRFAPSPTGFLHVGGARTALFSYLYARKHRGEFVLRIEDTDRERSTEKAVAAILNDMQWLGLTHDLGPFYQSERGPDYRKAVEYLLEKDLAYRCYCTREELDRLRREQQANRQKPRYDGRCRKREQPPAGQLEKTKPVIRFKTPQGGSVAFDDLVHGRIKISNSELDDLILLRADGSPTYNLTVVIDDASMRITHVIRGDDHLNNTPRQIHIFQALGMEVPCYAHLPMILNHDGSRMSKRSNAAAIGEYRQEGYLSQAMLNYLVRLGWSSGNQEIFSLNEMIEQFTLEAVNVSAASLNPEKLKWLNQHYLQTAPARRLLPLFEEQLATMGFSDYAESAPRVFEALRTRYKTLKDMAKGAAFIYDDDIESFERDKASRFLSLQTKPWLEYLLEQLKKIDPWVDHSIAQAIDATLAEFDISLSRLGPPLRFALTYGAASPELQKTLMLIGCEPCVRRLRKSLEWIEKSTGAE